MQFTTRRIFSPTRASVIVENATGSGDGLWMSENKRSSRPSPWQQGVSPFGFSVAKSQSATIRQVAELESTFMFVMSNHKEL